MTENDLLEPGIVGRFVLPIGYLTGSSIILLGILNSQTEAGLALLGLGFALIVLCMWIRENHTSYL